MGADNHPTVQPDGEQDRVEIEGRACDTCGRVQCDSYRVGDDCPRLRCDGELVYVDGTVHVTRRGD